MDFKRLKLRVLATGMDFLQAHRLAARLLLRPLANAPVLRRRMKVLPRAFMGATAFEIHDVDTKRGRIGIGGVEEVLFGSKIIHLLHTTLAEHLGEEEKNRVLYDLGVAQCQWEVSQALDGGRWAPAPLVPLIKHARILDEVQADPLMARFFANTMNMVSRLITDEGGWGRLTFDVSSMPLKVVLENSQEAQWLGPSLKPVCHFYAGIVAGYASAISGEDLVCREVECKAAGAKHCVFEVHRHER
ncbi:MAG: 4-vinyl reductase [Deltaproteobacteria bacterium]|nr:4-vinyl reductase [Deltaproteobacteria bacterium]